MNYEFDFHFLSGNFGVLWDGLKVTLQLALISNVVGLVIILAVLARIASRDPDSFAARMLAAMRNQFGGHEIKKQ